MNGSSSNELIKYLDDGTLEVISDGELAEIVGGIAKAAEPTNSGCNKGCPVTNAGC
ncbi:hypothetical protein [Xanthomonas graminis]|uniref:Uncharacterized protein n=1 Tax=Xanthomonas graminis pv. arrhenatheri LMG 727 TaxID=1195923 RepID=A0A0K2ZPV7_9XANT|nr:hypothetical protein [Xanthomonas translucens]UKE76463.1 hypothetical protein KM317_13390 [Xanthomonas translucens pv. arrhenatheri]CTP86987.1 hypothetical protein XTALMG727_1877 [Xanthomonas translucens pv. arrhenatheri LMG 727]